MKFRLWIGASGADVAVRLVAQLTSTVVIARILSAEEFGLATLVLVVATIMGALIGFPFEEAIAQRRLLRRGHLQTALFASGVLALIGLGLAIALGRIVEGWIGAPGFATLMIVAAVLLFAEGPRAVARGMARRQRRFVELASTQATSTVLACLLAIWAALAGLGVLALLIQRLVPNVIFPVLTALLVTRRGWRAWIPARWNAGRFREMIRFSGFHLLDIGVVYTTPAILAYLVNGVFGTAALGQLNIALRIVDPLRAGLMGIGHNLAFSALVKLQGEAATLVQTAGRIAAGVAVFVVPAFAGLTVSAPVMLPILVGPGWDAAVPLSQVLCIAAGLALPFRCIATGFSALGRPDRNVVADLSGLAVMVLAFLVAAELAVPLAAGLAYLANEVAIVAVLLVFARRAGGWQSLGPAIGRILRIGAAAALMGVVVHLAAVTGTVEAPSLLALTKIVVIGFVTFPLALLLVCPHCARDLLNAVRLHKT